LDNSMIPNYLAQFSWYLAQLQALEPNGVNISPPDIITPTPDISGTQAQDNSLTPTQ
jgi:hypothetical protein